MPINDSAGVGVYLIDKSQRATTTVGFRSAAAIEADRGLCETPTLISSAKDYVSVFGTPKMEKHGRGSMEAFMLAQSNVPQVLTRAKNPTMDPSATPFGLMAFGLTGTTLDMDRISASAIAAPGEDDKCNLFAKGEGDYFDGTKKNVVLRFSKPASYSAYCEPKRVLQLDVFDFDGASHIDEDTEAEFLPVKDISGMVNDSGDFHATLNGEDYVFGATGSTIAGQGDKVYLTVFVNGRTKQVEIPLEDLHDDDMGFGLWDQISKAVREVTNANGELVIPENSNEPFTYDGDKYTLDTRGKAGTSDAGKPQRVNCFNLSVSFSVEATLAFDAEGVKSGFFSFPGGSVTVNGTAKTAKFVINSSMFLANKGEYMFMGEQNSYWAQYYNAFRKESFVFSFSYDDYDANYSSIQADAVLASSNYLVSKSAENFGDYAVEADDDLVKTLKYFADDISSNEITGAGAKSNAYATALKGLLTDNLTRWRCLTAPNLGDVMNSSDYTDAIQNANEVTLGLSNLGQPASVDYYQGLSGRHGNRFISDFSQYVYRTLNGRRTAVTAASLVTVLLNQHYNDGIEARPPFGYTYGQISGLGLSQVLTGPQREELARVYKVNPIIEDGGLFLWDERTSQLTETSLSDTHSIISFLWMKFAIYDAMKSFVAEYNDASTVNRGLSVLKTLHANFVSRNYIEADPADLAVTAENNVLGSEVLRFDFRVRFKGVARYVDIFVTAYSQTQTLEVSLGEEA